MPTVFYCGARCLGLPLEATLLELSWIALVSCFLWIASDEIHTLPDLFQSFAKSGGVPRLRHFGFFSRFWREAAQFRECCTLLPFIPAWL